MSLVRPVLPFLILLTASGLARSAVAGPGKRDGELIGKFRNTYYHVAVQSDYPLQPADDALLAMDDTVLAEVTSKFRAKVDLEGTGKLLDGKVINYAGMRNNRPRYRFTSSPFGDGVGDCPLIPFHTIAVDPAEIPLGSVVRIDETIGMKLPDGTIHDGIWRAEDVGGAINRDRIDLFVGESDQGWVLVKAGIQNLQALTVRLVEPAASTSCVHHQR